jgi:hypothetical protein
MRTAINPRDLHLAYQRLETAAESNKDAAEMKTTVDAAFKGVSDAFKLAGFSVRVDDRAEELVGVLLGFLIDSNPSFRALIPAQSDDLMTPDGSVSITLEVGDALSTVGYFATITNAETYLATSAAVDPDYLEAGFYGINAPHGVGTDEFAIRLAASYGFDVFESTAGAYFTKDLHSEDDPHTWGKVYPSKTAAALAALATIEP